MTDEPNNPFTDTKLYLPARSFASGLVVVFLLTWICIVIVVILSVILFIPFNHFSGAINHFLQIKGSAVVEPTVIPDYRATLYVVYAIVAFSLLMFAPIQTTIWGARAFCYYDLRRSSIYMAMWAAWVYFWNWTSLFALSDLFIFAFAALYVIVSAIKAYLSAQTEPFSRAKKVYDLSTFSGLQWFFQCLKPLDTIKSCIDVQYKDGRTAFLNKFWIVPISLTVILNFPLFRTIGLDVEHDGLSVLFLFFSTSVNQAIGGFMLMTALKISRLPIKLEVALAAYTIYVICSPAIAPLQIPSNYISYNLLVYIKSQHLSFW